MSWLDIILIGINSNGVQVTLSGSFAVDCGEACVHPATTERVVIDYLTGAFIEGDL